MARNRKPIHGADAKVGGRVQFATWREWNFERESIIAALAGRRDSCWERLADVVSELHELHEVSEEDIVAEVRAAIVSGGDLVSEPAQPHSPRRAA
jgi:hypothetical protein